MDILKYFCHRLPSRSFFYKGHQFPVCARCTGIYVGMGLLFVLAWFKKDLIELHLLTLIFGILLVIPTFADGFIQYFSDYESNNKLRVVTGFFGGLGLIILSKFTNFLLKSLFI